MKVEILKPFSYKGKLLKVGEEVVLSKDAAALYTKIDHAKEVKQAPAKSGKNN